MWAWHPDRTLWRHNLNLPARMPLHSATARVEKRQRKRPEKLLACFESLNVPCAVQTSTANPTTMTGASREDQQQYGGKGARGP